MIEAKNMPLYWRCKDSPHQEIGLPPARADFVFDFDHQLNLFIEKKTPELSLLLQDIYSRHANVGFIQDGNELVNTYGADFWRFLLPLVEKMSKPSVLEIGCGGCLFLERLKNIGCNVLGVDPSPIALQSGLLKEIEVIQDYFPVKNLTITPNLIFQVDVLEHIEDPVSFLQSQRKALADDGIIVVNVPNCSHSIAKGDISMALHQHVNMFDEISLPNVFKAAGFEILKLQHSTYGSALFCAAIKSKSKQALTLDINNRWLTFQDKAQINIQHFIKQVKAASSLGSVGFFMPQRAFPYLSFLNEFGDFRIFDNMNVWHNKYLDGLAIKIENQQDLVDDPVDHLFIMSLTFGEEVAQTLREDIPSMNITTLDELVNL
jgi:2-polyprenyl-3-methyl-5-hydroxy-6-metoxy-1,4-benzoquinol methylase